MLNYGAYLFARVVPRDKILFIVPYKNKSLLETAKFWKDFRIARKILEIVSFPIWDGRGEGLIPGY